MEDLTPTVEFVKPDVFTLNTVMAGYKKFRRKTCLYECAKVRARLRDVFHIQSNTVTMNILLECWIISGRQDAPEQAVKILNYMERGYQSGKRTVKPDSQSYRAVIDCFSKTKTCLNAGELGEGILRQMALFHREHNGEAPGVRIFNAVLNAHAGSKVEERGDKALALLNRMEERCTLSLSFGDETVLYSSISTSSPPLRMPSPTTVSYNIVLKSMQTGKTRDAQRADRLLMRMEEGNASSRPDSISYCTVISAYGKSDSEEKSKQSFNVLKRLVAASTRYQSSQRNNSRAVPYAFNAALNACCFAHETSAQREESFSIVQEIMNMMESFPGTCSADEVTYGTILRICAQLLTEDDPRRNEMAKRAFSEACEKGLCGHFVLSQLRFAAGDNLYRSLLGCSPSTKLQTSDVPAHWTRKLT